MIIEFKRIQTSYIEVESKEEMMKELGMERDHQAIASNLWEDEDLSEDSKIFLENLFDNHALDIKHNIERSVD